MTEHSLPTYNDLSLALSNTKPMTNPSEAHGVIVAFICAKDRSKRWENLITGDQKSQSVQELLQTLFNVSAKQLQSGDFEFALILPEDSASLPSRAEALTLWCQGFLTGLKLNNLQTGELPKDIKDAIDDITEIAKMQYEAVVESEEDEEAYVELVEYIRVAVIMIYEASHPETANNNTNECLH